ncbi:hypothetical protein SAMN02745227_02169 [Anaerobranca californiensis DSM 14826]|jgi:hypothetical protein|uniref:Uncharacterized protein n=1 Tax=Anaerobranca californiensis DSM 14826 TaxID=1120989 RepID=A0A1M6S4Q1_9FIRM|nr:hypothetical protein [Anaerobranca californiensis]SHK39665.1 hypothetical protein SAMN02745227_02169 [Anaerobranca californiensis DSM 14826]
MQLKKVAIIKNGIDIGRIIPFNMEQGEYDFKISFSKNDYEVNMYHFLLKVPEKVELDDMTSWEISYHRSTVLKPTVIHLKEKKNQPEYKPLPLKRLVDPSLYNEFPIPFMRIEIPTHLKGKNYKSKPKEHIEFDMEESNVAEFYLTNVNFDGEVFINKWPAVSFKLIVLSFEFFATNNLLTDKYKIKYFMPTDGQPHLASKEFIVNDDMKFYVNMYNNPELTGDKIKVTFIENEFAEALLGLSPVGYKNEQGEVEMQPAYKEDLGRDTMSSEEKRKWEYRFSNMRDKLESELKKAKRREW